MTKYINIGIIAILAEVALSNCQTSEAQQEPFSAQQETKVIPVKVAEVLATHEPIVIESSGVLASKTETNLSFKIGGIVAGIYVDEGHKVKAGQLMAKLDQAEINARVLQAKTSLEKVARNFERIDNLYRDSVATLEQRQDALTAYDVAKSELEVALFDQKHSAIYAPANGKILRKHVNANELVFPGASILEFASTNQDHVIRIGVSDKNIVRVQMNDSARVFFDAYPTALFSAYVSEIGESADEHTGVFEIELTVKPQEGHVMKNGFIGKVKIFTSPDQKYFKIPMDALVEADHEQVSIYVADENTARLEYVKPLQIGNDYFTTPALDMEERKMIITSGVAYLKEGDRISIQEKESRIQNPESRRQNSEVNE
jgi:membrane fusion protein, multidrug efflux system